MLFLIVLFTLLAIGSAIAGVVAGSGSYLLGAALFGAISFVLLRRVNGDREVDPYSQDDFFTSGPTIDLDRRLRSTRPPRSETLERARPTPVVDIAIDGYDNLLAAEILPALETLSVEQLARVIQHEKAGLGRAAVMNRAQVLIDLTRESTIDLDAPVAPFVPRSTPFEPRPDSSQPAFDDPFQDQRHRRQQDWQRQDRQKIQDLRDRQRDERKERDQAFKDKSDKDKKDREEKKKEQDKKREQDLQDRQEKEQTRRKGPDMSL